MNPRMMLHLRVFYLCCLVLEVILHRALTFLCVLGAQALTAFVPDSLFKDVCSQGPWMAEMMSLTGTEGWLIYYPAE